MRKPRDYDAELKALGARAAKLRSRKVQQLGELVIATGADALPIEQFAGALLAAAQEKHANVREGWRKTGAAFFQTTGRTSGDAAPNDTSAAPGSSSTLPLDGDEGAS
jgi:hypothetical protein